MTYTIRNTSWRVFDGLGEIFRVVVLSDDEVDKYTFVANPSHAVYSHMTRAEFEKMVINEIVPKEMEKMLRE